MKKPLQVGITGGIGTGKSTVARLFGVLRVPTYEADVRAKWLLENHPILKEELIAAFGAQTYQVGRYNRDYIAKIVFGDAQKLAQLNGLVHPRVFEDYGHWAQAHADAPYLLRESALLFESGMGQDVVLVVAAPLELRISRVLQRDPFRTEAELRAIIGKQMPEADKISRAHFVIHNDETQLLIPQVLRIHEQLLGMRDANPN